MAGLGQPLQTNVTLHKPAMLDEAVMHLCAYEQRDKLLPVMPTFYGHSSSRQSDRTLASAIQSASASSPTAPTVSSTGKPTTKCLSPMEIAERRHKGKCFRCDDLYTQGHQDLCRQLYVIEVVFDPDDATPPALDTELNPTISLHALTGIQLHHATDHPHQRRPPHRLVGFRVHSQFRG
jgi:hypothetical protein